MLHACLFNHVLLIISLQLTFITCHKHSQRHHHRRRRSVPSHSALPEYTFSLLTPERLADNSNEEHLEYTQEQYSDMRKYNESQLLAILQMDNEFNRGFISIRKPQEALDAPNGTLVYSTKNGKIPKAKNLPAQLQALSQRTIQLTQDGPAIKVRFDTKTRRKLQRFLWAYTFCPVRYIWQYQGEHVWPRWVKYGQCEKRKSCSIPEGLQCATSQQTVFQRLRYLPADGWVVENVRTTIQCDCGCKT